MNAQGVPSPFREFPRPRAKVRFHPRPMPASTPRRVSSAIPAKARTYPLQPRLSHKTEESTGKAGCLSEASSGVPVLSHHSGRLTQSGRAHFSGDGRVWEPSQRFPMPFGSFGHPKEQQPPHRQWNALRPAGRSRKVGREGAWSASRTPCRPAGRSGKAPPPHPQKTSHSNNFPFKDIPFKKLPIPKPINIKCQADNAPYSSTSRRARV